MPLLSLLWMFFLVALCSWALSNAMVGLSLPFLKSQSSAHQRGTFWLVLLLPWLLPIVAVISIALLALAKYLGLIDDHCDVHLQHHPHFCFAHLPEFVIGISQSLYGLLFIFSASSIFIWQLFSQYQQQCITHTLSHLAHSNRRLKVLSEKRPMAFTSGLKQPAVFLTTGLINLLTKRQQRIVVAHECAHIRNGDILKNALVEIILTLHIWRRPLRKQWRLHSELLADSAAAKQFSSWEIAEVLLTLRRANSPRSMALSVAGADLEKRINHLLRPDLSLKQHWLLPVFIMMAVITAPLLIAVDHHALETWIGWLLF